MTSTVRGYERRVDVYRETDTDEFCRLMEMVLAARDFGLDQAEACAVADEALSHQDPDAESLERVAAALAERLMEHARGQVRARPRT
jgi:enoyl-CoA hydratase/carnithine racemase